MGRQIVADRFCGWVGIQVSRCAGTMVTQNLCKFLSNVWFNLGLIPQEGAHAWYYLVGQELEIAETLGRTKHDQQKRIKEPIESNPLKADGRDCIWPTVRDTMYRENLNWRSSLGPHLGDWVSLQNRTWEILHWINYCRTHIGSQTELASVKSTWICTRNSV